MITVIIPVYNTGEYLHRCITSILNQSYKDFELICVNDGSQDNSLEILNYYREIDSRVRIIDQKNSGVSKARNTGLHFAKGEYICFLDSDDWVHPQYLEALLAGIEQTKADMSVVRYQEIIDYDRDIKEDCVNLDESISIITKRQLLDEYRLKSRCWGKLFNKDYINEDDFPVDVKIGEDSVFVLQYLDRLNDNAKICVINHILYYYFHNREDSAINTMVKSDSLRWADYLISKIDDSSKWLRVTFAEEGCKKLLNVRNSAYLTKEKEIVHQSNARIKTILNKTSIKEFGTIRFLMYKVFFRLPQTYHLFILLKDPTLLKYERRVRNMNTKEHK